MTGRADNRPFVLPFGFGVRFTRERGISFTRNRDGETQIVSRRYVKSPPTGVSDQDRGIYVPRPVPCPKEE